MDLSPRVDPNFVESRALTVLHDDFQFHFEADIDNFSTPGNALDLFLDLKGLRLKQRLDHRNRVLSAHDFPVWLSPLIFIAYQTLPLCKVSGKIYPF